MREWLEEVERRLEGARLDGAAQREIAEELAQHLHDRHVELRSRGVSAAEARAQVLAELGEGGALARLVGAVVRTRPEPLPIGRATVGGWLGGLWSDVRFGTRMLLRTPAYAGFAVFVIALAIGVNTAIFTVVDSLLLRPPSGVTEPERLAAIFTSDYSGPRYGSSSYPDLLAVKEAGAVFDDVAAYSLQTFRMVGDGWADGGMGEIVTANYFRVLGVRPALGRFFSADEGEPGRTSSVVVIGHDLWLRQFGGGSDALGSTIIVRGQPLTVIGVAPRDFGGSLNGLRSQLWLPVSAPPALLGNDPSRRGNRGFQVRARLRPGVDLRSAQEALNVVAARLHGEFPEQWTDVHARARQLTIVPESNARVPPRSRGAVVGFLGALTAAMFVVLLIACTNVANLMLSRATVRRAEMGVRVALGATRGRIVRHLLAESLVLASVGGAGGVLLAVWLMGLLRAVRVPGVHVTIQVGVNWHVLAFAAAMTVATGLLFGLAPAVQASGAPAPLLKDDARGGRRTRTRQALVGVQIASSLVLLIGGALLLRSLGAMQRSDTGYDADDVVLARFELSGEGYSPERAAAFYDDFIARVGALPGVASVTLGHEVPLGMGWSRQSVDVEAYEPAEGEDMEVLNNGVAPGWFRMMGMTLRRGRDFASSDRPGAPPVVIVSEAFARRFWPHEDVLGKRVGLDGRDAAYAEVIGIAPDARYRSRDDEPQPYFYYPYLQRPAMDMTVYARPTGDPDALATALRSLSRMLAPTVPPPTVVHTFRAHRSLARLPETVAALALSGLGLLAVAIAVIGLYGLIAFGVAQRAREFGIRMALGAAAGDVRRLVLGDALRPVAIGIVCGAPAALAVAFLLHGFLLVPPLDPVSFLGVPALLVICALLASHGPARRAIAQDPASALRVE